MVDCRFAREQRNCTPFNLSAMRLVEPENLHQRMAKQDASQAGTFSGLSGIGKNINMRW